MKVLLTGITGNLGNELAYDLVKRGIEVTPIVRPGKRDILTQYKNVVESDLLEEDPIEFEGFADAIVHTAGIVHFLKSGNANETMMRKVLRLADHEKIPLFFVSTAFAYKPPGTNATFNNGYEEDKYRAEQVLVKSNIPHAIFRPSVLTGNSRTGRLQNFSGYYLLVGSFLRAVRDSSATSEAIRFPRMAGKSDMVPVDEAAHNIAEAIQHRRLGTFFVTNPTPPESQWVLDETLNFYGLRDRVDIIDMPFNEFGHLNLTAEERALYKFASHFAPYWSMDYSFPSSICERNLIHHDYIGKILTFFRDSQDLAHERISH